MRTFWTVVLTLLFTLASGGAIYGVVKYYINKYEPVYYTVTIMEGDEEIEQLSLKGQTELLTHLNSKYNSSTGYEYVYHIDTADGVLMASNYKLVRDITLYRSKQIINYTITYNLNGGQFSTAYVKTYTYETESFTLINPTKQGYTFKGWIGSNSATPEQLVVIQKNSTGNKSFDAQWAPVEYTISYNLAGGVNSTANPSEYTVEDGFVLADATKSGYDFVGWYREQNYVNKVSEISVGTRGSLNLFAKFNVHQYLVKFMNGNQLVDTKFFTVENNSTDFIVAPSVPSIKGYNNIYWPSFTIVGRTEDVTVVLHKTPIEYTVTFKGLASGNVVKTYTIETLDYFTFPEIDQSTNPGYQMTWNLTIDSLRETLGNREVTFSQTPIVYTITYNLKDGSIVGTNPKTYTIESVINLISPTKAGYAFAGWYEGANKVTSISNRFGNIALEAHYNIITYHVFFKEGSTTLYTRDYTVENRNISIPTAPSRSGYSTSWESFSITTGYGDKTVNLVKTATDYSITYKLNGGTNNTSNPNKYNIETPTISLKSATKSGYSFVGWYANSDFSGSKVTSIALGSTGNKTLYAKFSATSYLITYVLNGGTNGANPTSYTIESSTITLKDATKSGYKFDGWYTNSNFTGSKVTKISSGSTGDKTFYAKFIQIKTYLVDLDFTSAGSTYYAASYDYITVKGVVGDYCDVYYNDINSVEHKYGTIEAFAEYIYTAKGRSAYRINGTEVNSLQEFKTAFIAAATSQTSLHKVTIDY